MKTLVILCVLLATASASEKWEKFKLLHGKSYSNVKEDSHRRAVFEKNTRLIAEHNARFRNGDVSYSVDINRFADMTTEEFVDRMTSLRKLESTDGMMYATFPQKERAAEVDWRDSGAVTPVKNQEECGSCWAFSAIATIESAHFIKYGSLMNMSEQQLVDCDDQNSGCDGGVVQWTYDYIKSAGGVSSRSAYPYEGKQMWCRFDGQSTVASISGYLNVPYMNEEAQVAAVHDHGPVSVCVDAGHWSFQFYKSGVYYEKNCNALQINHAVVAVGYGSEDGSDYWIIKNSWGTEWGDQGYMKIARNKENHCGIATQSCYPTI